MTRIFPHQTVPDANLPKEAMLREFNTTLQPDKRTCIDVKHSGSRRMPNTLGDCAGKLMKCQGCQLLCRYQMSNFAL